jgi:hypothetical protein
MILLLRGHLRNAFSDSRLFDLVSEIYNLDKTLKIYIHTWNVVSNNISWRNIEINETVVTNDTIYNYFGKLSSLISAILIDDDKDIPRIGNISGNLGKSLVPIIGWKNYWYGKHRLIDYVYNTNISKDELVINCRFDVLTNSNSLKIDEIIKFIQSNLGSIFTKNIFIKDVEWTGIDNIYLGNIETMKKLSDIFYYKLDDIIKRDDDNVNPERLVFRISNTL